jgi:transcriptional regulator with XRE-family HTH domain
MAFKDEFKKYRELRELTQEDIADAIGISRQSVSKWENGNSEPDIETIKQLALIFDCSTDQLLGFVSNETHVARVKNARFKKFLWISLFSIGVMLLLIGAFLLLHFLQPGINGNLNPDQKGLESVGPYFLRSDFDHYSLVLGTKAGITDHGQAFLYGADKLYANYTLHGDYYYYNNYPLPSYGFLITAIVFSSLTVIFAIALLVVIIRRRNRNKAEIKQQ